MQRKTTAWLGLGAAAMLALTGCSNKASDSGGGGGEDGDLKTDFGVTDTEIKLGIQTDLTSVFKAVGLNLTQGNELWADEVNADGGICGRQIVYEVLDNSYKPDVATALYDQSKNNILGYMQLLGSPIVAAVKGKVIADQMTATIATNSTINLDNDYLMMGGTGYDLEMINGLYWAMEQGMIAEGDKIAHIYIDSEYGQNGLLGAEYFAQQHNIEVVKVPVAASDTDMTTTMTKIKQEGVKLIALSVAPAATGSVALQNVEQGLNVPIMGNNPIFATTLLADAGVVAALENVYLSMGFEPFAGNSEKNKEIQAAFEEKYPGEAPGYGVPGGYIGGMIWGAILEKACENGDMTRQGLVEARLSLDNVDAQGISDDMDLSDPGVPPVRSSYILQLDANTPGGHTIHDGPILSPDAEEYKTPYQKD